MTRMHDLLMTETPRPVGNDKPFTSYATLYSNAVVIDATQVTELFLGLTQFTEEVHNDLKELGGDSVAWQMAQFFAFDWNTLDNVAPPFRCMNIEFDTAEALRLFTLSCGNKWDDEARRSSVNVGRSCVAMYYADIEGFEDEWLDHHRAKENGDLAEMLAYADLGWIMVVHVFFTAPGRGLIGPNATWFIPVSESGKLYQVSPDAQGRTHLHAILSPPDEPGGGIVWDKTPRQAVAMGWQTLIPALMAINFMHTPQGEKGYHNRVETGASRGEQKHFMRRNFRPLSKWYVLDIHPLREALRASNGGKHPTTLAGLQKALHLVRGNYAHYAPNTYFGRKHEDWITVFRPGHKRGDLAAGKIDKDYRIS